jgi:hypothetical protein
VRSGRIPGQRGRFKVDRDRREPQLQPGGKCVLAGPRQPLRVIAGYPHRGRVQVAGDDLQFPLHHRILEARAGAVAVGGEAAGVTGAAGQAGQRLRLGPGAAYLAGQVQSLLVA